MANRKGHRRFGNVRRRPGIGLGLTLSWHASGTAHCSDPRLAKERTVTRRELESFPIHGQ